jgi:hypothetical protein
MNTSSQSARTYRWLGYLAVAHAVVVFGLTALVLGFGSDSFWLRRLWVGLVTLWFFWLPVLALHQGRSFLRFTVWVSLSAVVLFPTWRFYDLFAPQAFGLSPFVHMNPWSMWEYYSAYLAGRTEAKKDVGTGVLVIEESGFGAGGGPHVQRILRDRYGVEIRGVAGCVVNERIMGHEDGYNSVSQSEIDRRFGHERVEAAREEGNRLQQAEYERYEQSIRSLTKRLSSLAEDGKVTTKMIRAYLDGQPLYDSATVPDLATFVHAVEKCVIDAVPEETPAFDFIVSARMEPDTRPSFGMSALIHCNPRRRKYSTV